MKFRLSVLVLVAAALAIVCIPAAAAAPPAPDVPEVTITLLNPPPENLLELDVGESYTFDISISSSEPFVLAAAQTDAFYPGRGIYWHGGDRTTRGTTALLHLTMTGKNSTANLRAVCGWPEPDDCWPAGTAPAAIVAGVRLKGGITVAEVFAFAVQVPGGD